MKKLITIITVFVLLLSCSKDEKEDPAILEVTLSYYDIVLKDYKPDIYADAYLFPESIGKNVDLSKCMMVTAKLGLLDDSNEKLIGAYSYKGEADATGKLIIKDIAPGKYLLLVSSNGRMTYSTKMITLPAGQTVYETKKFSKEYLDSGEPW